MDGAVNSSDDEQREREMRPSKRVSWKEKERPWLLQMGHVVSSRVTSLFCKVWRMRWVMDKGDDPYSRPQDS